MDFKKGREFVYRNARPLDLALWEYYFENGSTENVMEKLAFYQNEDGGFGHALEADVWNPNSIPIGTWKATEILAEIGSVDSKHPIVQGILKYLDCKDGFDSETGQWGNTMPTNNEYPHAIWWEHNGKPADFNPNPSAALAGFIVAYAEEQSELYQLGCKMVIRCFDYMVENCPIKEEHVIACYIRLYKYLTQSKMTDIVELKKFEECLIQMVDNSLCRDMEKWGKEYVPMPSTFIDSPESFLYNGKQDLIQKECRMIKEQQLDDGSFVVPWSWCTDYREFEVAANWWKSELIIKKFLFLKKFGQL